MPFNITSCLCTSTLSLDSLHPQKNSTQGISSSGGYFTTSTSVKAADIKPPVTGSPVKLRISAKEFSQYKESMDSIVGSNKEVFLDNFSSRNERASLDISDTQTSLTVPINALDDDDTDLVPFEEFEEWRQQRFINALDDDDTDLVPFEEFDEWRQQRLKDSVSTTLSDSDTIRASKQSVEQAISTDYDVPRKFGASTDYDVPRKFGASTDYDVPRKFGASTDYDVPRKFGASTDYDVPKKLEVPTDYDVPRKLGVPADHNVQRKQVIPTDHKVQREPAISNVYDTPRKQTIPNNYDIPRKL